MACGGGLRQLGHMSPSSPFRDQNVLACPPLPAVRVPRAPWLLGAAYTAGPPLVRDNKHRSRRAFHLAHLHSPAVAISSFPPLPSERQTATGDFFFLQLLLA